MELKIVDFETGKLLEELGLERRWCDVAYRDDDQKLYRDTGMYTDYCAPTQELARKFLRDKHNIDIHVKSHQYDETTIKEYFIEIRFWNSSSPNHLRLRDIFDTYEKALEEGLKQACIYLKDGNK